MARDTYGLRMEIDGERYTTGEVEIWDGSLPLIVTEEGAEFYLAESSETAGEAARDYWENLAQSDPSEFVFIVGEKTLVAWGLGQYAGPGSSQVKSLEEWLDLWLDVPEEHWASWDGCELEVTRIGQLARELGFVPTVAYRCN